jgi:hypothetical protein
LPFTLSLALLTSAGSAATLTLAWDPNTEPHLEGYVIYRNTGSPGPPYEYSEPLPEDELDDPLNPHVTITGLNEGIKYYFATSAYGTEGNKSDFSNEVCVQVSEGSVGICSDSVISGSGSNSGSGGGSGACFISSIIGGEPQNSKVIGLKSSGYREMENPAETLIKAPMREIIRAALFQIRKKSKAITSRLKITIITIMKVAFQNK